jgi:ketosteroid isomerase-like protein
MSDIQDLLTRYATAAREKDVEGLAAIYHEDVRVFDAWGTFEHRGLSSWRPSIEGWLGSLADETVAVTFEDVEERGPLASMFVRYAGVSAAGEELRAMTNRMTWVVEDGKVVHEHSSSPASFETGKVILSR